MNNLFDQTDVSEILIRMDKLTADSQNHLGKMNHGQMLAHLNAVL